MEDYDNSCDDFDDSCGDDYCDGGGYGQSSGRKEDSFRELLNMTLLIIGLLFGVGMLLATLICLVPKGDMKDILGGFATSAIGFLALWWLHKRDKRILSDLLKIFLSDIFK